MLNFAGFDAQSRPAYSERTTPAQIRSDLDVKTILFTQNEVDAIYTKLQGQANVTAEIKEKYNEEIKERTDGIVCPFCGKQLVLRNGKYGSFYGCTGYPPMSVQSANKEIAQLML